MTAPVVRKGGKPPEKKAPTPGRCRGCNKIRLPLDAGGLCDRCHRIIQVLRRDEARAYGSPITEAPWRVSPTQPVSPQGSGPPPASAADGLASLIAGWRPAPWLFVRECIGAEPDLWQDECLHALIESGLTRFVLKACKGPGKSTLLAWVIWWFLVCHINAKVVCTSITEPNLKDGLWTELALWRSKSKLLYALFEFQSEKIYCRSAPDTWFCSARTWPKDADKNKQADTLAGIHAQNSMIVLDEAGGIPVGVLVAGLAHHSTQHEAEGAVQEVHYTLMAGNPTQLDGALGWACTEDSKNWWVKEITGDPADPKRAPRIDKKWAQDMIDTHGAESPWVLVNVFGKFPPVGWNKLLGPDQIRAAMAWAGPRDWKRHGRVMALDVARSTGRDQSVLCRRQGSVIFPFRKYRIDDANELAGQVAFEYSRWQADLIIVDAAGLGGPVADHLRALNLPVVMFYGGASARDKRFVDRRTETWWVTAQEIKGSKGANGEAAEPALALPNDPDLVPQGTAPNLEWNAKGQMKLEGKESMLKRGIASPDVFDALTMTSAEPVGLRTEIPESTMAAVRGGRVAVEYDPYEDK